MTRVLLGSVLHFISLSMVFQFWSSREPPRLHLRTVTKLPLDQRASPASPTWPEELHDATAFVIYLLGNWHRHRNSSKENHFMVIFHPKYLTNVIYVIKSIRKVQFQKKKTNASLGAHRGKLGTFGFSVPLVRLEAEVAFSFWKLNLCFQLFVLLGSFKGLKMTSNQNQNVFRFPC